MSASGVARVQGPPDQGLRHKTLYNNDWTAPYEPSAVDTLPEGHMGTDISEHELGVRNVDDETREGGYLSASERRQAERKEARREAWKKQYGGGGSADDQD